MERRYYLLKIGLIALAIATAVVTGGISHQSRVRTLQSLGSAHD